MDPAVQKNLKIFFNFFIEKKNLNVICTFQTRHLRKTFYFFNLQQNQTRNHSVKKLFTFRSNKKHKILAALAPRPLSSEKLFNLKSNWLHSSFRKLVRKKLFSLSQKTFRNFYQLNIWLQAYNFLEKLNRRRKCGCVSFHTSYFKSSIIVS